LAWNLAFQWLWVQRVLRGESGLSSFQFMSGVLFWEKRHNVFLVFPAQAFLLGVPANGALL
jgi:hypothetical protein